MKTFRLIGMTLLMVMLAVNFTACSDDDEIEKITSEDNTLQLLVGSWEYKDDESVETYQFNADYSYTYSYNLYGIIKTRKVLIVTTLIDTY